MTGREPDGVSYFEITECVCCAEPQDTVWITSSRDRKEAAIVTLICGSCASRATMLNLLPKRIGNIVDEYDQEG